MVLEYIIHQKQDIYSFFSSSYGTFTKIDHIWFDSQSSPAGGFFKKMHQQSPHTGNSDTCPSPGTPGPSGTFVTLDRLWPAGQTYCPHRSGSGHAIPLLGLQTGSVNNAFLKGVMGRWVETPTLLGSPLWSAHILLPVIQREGYPESSRDLGINQLGFEASSICWKTPHAFGVPEGMP